MTLKPADGKCFNCGSKAHTKPDCPRPKKETGETSPRRKKGGGAMSAAAVSPEEENVGTSSTT